MSAAEVNLGQVYLQERNVKEALPMFREALAREPYNVTAAYGLATTLLRSGEADAGREAMQQFQKLRDSAYGVTYAPGYLQQGRNAEAIVSTGAEPELVDEATPRVTFADATPPAFAARPPDQASATGERLTLFDIDGDGDQDLLVLDAAALHLYRNDGGRFTDVTAATKLDARLPGRGVGAVAGDYDNDGKPDLFVLRDEGPRLLHQRADGAFEDVTGAALGSSGAIAARTAAFADVDHDGDLDIVIAGTSVPNRLLRNNGNGTFTDIASEAERPVLQPGPSASSRPTTTTAGTSIFSSCSEDRAPTLYQNMRDGTFRDVAQDVGLAAAGPARAVAAGDVNKDGYTDLFIARAGQPPVFAMSDGRTPLRAARRAASVSRCGGGAIRRLRQRWSARSADLRSWRATPVSKPRNALGGCQRRGLPGQLEAAGHPAVDCAISMATATAMSSPRTTRVSCRSGATREGTVVLRFGSSWPRA